MRRNTEDRHELYDYPDEWEAIPFTRLSVTLMAVIANLSVTGLFVAGALWTARSSEFRTLWPSWLFYPLVGAILLTGLLVILIRRGSWAFTNVRLAVVAAELIFVSISLYAVGNNTYPTCGRFSDPSNQNLIMLTADTFSLDGQVRCTWSDPSDSTVGEIYQYPVFRTLVGTV